MRLVLRNSIHIEYVAVSENNNAALIAEDVLVVELYKKLVDDFADFCLSPNDKVEIFSDDLDSICDVYYLLVCSDSY